MTALLQCDGCGNVVGERADDEDSTRTWWCLSPAPIIGGGLLPILSLTSDAEWASDDTPDDDIPPLDPPRHFCSEGCITSWAEHRKVPS